METIKDVTQLFVAVDGTNTAAIEGDTITTYSDLTDGEIVVCDHKNVVLTSSDNLVAADFPTQQFKIVGRAGTVLFESPLLRQGQIKSYSVGNQSAEVQQVDYIGSNGTTGALDAIASNIYTVRLYVQGATISDFMQQKIKEGFYKSNTAAASYLQETVATGLYDSLIANFSREPEEEIRFGRTNSGARLALGTGVGTVVFTKGSKTVTAGTDIDDATTNAVLQVGEYISAGVGVTQSLYKIVSIDTTANTLIIDRAFNDATVSGADTTVGRILAATSAAADSGVKLTGIDRGFKTGFFDSAVVAWKTNLDFGDNQTTTVIESVAPYPGVGTAQQVAKLEKELQADNNVYRSFVEAGVIDRAQVVAGILYDIVIIEYWDEITTGLGSVVKSPKTIQIASSGGGPNSVLEDADSGVIVALDKIIVTNWATPGAVVLQALLT